MTSMTYLTKKIPASDDAVVTCSLSPLSPSLLSSLLSLFLPLLLSPFILNVSSAFLSFYIDLVIHYVCPSHQG